MLVIYIFTLVNRDIQNINFVMYLMINVLFLLFHTLLMIFCLFKMIFFQFFLESSILFRYLINNLKQFFYLKCFIRFIFAKLKCIQIFFKTINFMLFLIYNAIFHLNQARCTLIIFACSSLNIYISLFIFSIFSVK